MAMTFGNPETKSDEDVLEGISFWEAKEREYVAAKEQDAVAQCRDEAEKYRAEARKRGLI